MQPVPIYSSIKIVTMLKSIIVRELLKKHPDIKKQLCGGNLWTSGYFVNTVSKTRDETSLSNYVKD